MQVSSKLTIGDWKVNAEKAAPTGPTLLFDAEVRRIVIRRVACDVAGGSGKSKCGVEACRYYLSGGRYAQHIRRGKSVV